MADNESFELSFGENDTFDTTGIDIISGAEALEHRAITPHNLGAYAADAGMVAPEASLGVSPERREQPYPHGKDHDLQQVLENPQRYGAWQ